MSRRWLVSELLDELRADASRTVLIVEGLKDERFWMRMAPLQERINAVVYTVDNIELPDGTDGQRGRVLRLALEVNQTEYAGRFLFFIDADFDHISGRVHAPNVALTDFRDLESYGLVSECLMTLCQDQFSLPDARVDEVERQIEEVGRPLSLLRWIDHQLKLRLPFQETMSREAGKRFSNRAGPRLRVLDKDRLLASLMNSVGQQGRMREVASEFDRQATAYGGYDLKMILHGKDFLSIIAWYFETTADIAEALVFGSIYSNLAGVKMLPSLARAEAWTRA